MTEPEPQLMHSPQNCPVYEDGWHRLAPKGRDEPMYADRFECSCGHTEYGNTNEHKARYGT